MFYVSSLEWNAMALGILILSIQFDFLRIVPLVMFACTILAGLMHMMGARLEPKFDSVVTRLLVFYLAVAQPVVRAWARHFTWLREKRTPLSVLKSKEERPHDQVSYWGAHQLALWSESGRERTDLLTEVATLLEEEGWKYALDTGWTDWDAQIFANRWWNVRLRTLTEIYPHGKRLTRVGNHLLISNFSIVIGAALAAFVLMLGLAFPQTLFATLPLAAFAVGVWFVKGLNLRFRVAELVLAGARRAGLLGVKS
jgi:hypothetical protein